MHSRVHRLFLFLVLYTGILMPAWGAKTVQKRVGEYLIQATVWTIEDGLPHWTVQDVLETADGHIWLLLPEKLVRFDGSQFEQYILPNDGMDFKNPGYLAYDGDDYIWIHGFNRSGQITLKVFDTSQKVFVDAQSNQEEYAVFHKPLGAQNFFSILFDLAGDVYLSIQSGQLWKFTQGKATSIDIHKSNRQDVQVYPAKKDLIWTWISADRTLELMNQHGQVQKKYIIHNKHTVFWLDIDLTLWAWDPNTGGYTRFLIDEEPETFRFDSLPPTRWGNFVKLAHFPRPNSEGHALYWQGTDLTLRFEDQIIEQDLQHWVQTELGMIPSPYARPYLMSDNTFLLTGSYGLLRIQVTKSLFSTSLIHPTSPPTSIRSIHPWDDSSLLVTTYRGNFLVMLNDLSNSTKIDLPFFDHEAIGYRVFSQRQHTWIGSSFRSLLKYDVQKGTFSPISPQNQSFAHEMLDFGALPNSDSLVMASNNGLFFIHESSNTYTPFRFQDTAVFCLQKHGKTYWVGTDRGLYDWTNQRFALTKGRIGGALTVYHILPTSHACLWLATNQGLVLWSPILNKAYYFDIESPFPIPRIHCVYSDARGKLWMSSNEGLFSLHPEKGELEIYTERDGLSNSEFNLLAHYQSPDGTLYMGTVNGLVSFSPDQMEGRSHQEGAFTAYIDEVNLYNGGSKSALNAKYIRNHSGTIKVPQSIRFLSIRFSVPFFEIPGLILQWRIPGITDSWQRISNSELNLPVPPHGTHVIQVRVHQQGKPSQLQEQDLVKLLIPPPIYFTIWFWVLILVLVAVLATMAVKLRTRYLIAHQKELRLLVRNQVSDIEAKMQKIDRQKRALDVINEQKSRFFSNLIHDLRTPIAIISGYAQSLAKSTSLDSISRDMASRLQNNVQDLQNIAEEIHDLTRIDTGALVLETEPVEWPGFLRILVEDWRIIAGKKGQRLYLTSASPAFYQLADAVKLRRIINNLLNNAIKYTPRGGEIRVTELVENGMIVLCVRDNGPGIPQHEQELVFQRFYRVSRTAAEGDPTGLGIGLTIGKEYAELMGGSLSLSSEPGHGTEFTFRLPIQVADTPEIPVPREKEVPYQLPDHAQILTPVADIAHTILIVEDNLKMQDYLKHLMGSRAHIVTANDGQEALEYLKQNGASVDLIISDVKMPRKDGFELLRALRSDDQHPAQTVPFLLLTALPESEYSLEAFRIGVDGYLSKPFNQDELLARVENLIERFASRRAVSTPPNLSEPESDQVPAVEIPNYESAWMEQFRQALHKQIGNSDLKVNELASELFVSERTLRNKIALFTGLTPARLIMLERLNMAYNLLRAKRYATVAEVCHAVGIRNVSHFTRAFKKEFGRLPSDLLK